MRTNADAAREIIKFLIALFVEWPHDKQGEPAPKYVARLTALLDKLYPVPESTDGWYCPHCRRAVPSDEATYEETHDQCGTPLGVAPPNLEVPESLEEDRVECERCGKQGCDLCIPVDDGNTYACWRCRIPIREIKTDDDYKEAMAYVDAHMDDDENSDLQVVAILIEDYERRSSKPPVPESLERAVRTTLKNNVYRFRDKQTCDRWKQADELAAEVVEAVAPLLPTPSYDMMKAARDLAHAGIKDRDKQIAELEVKLSNLLTLSSADPTCRLPDDLPDGKSR